MFSDKLEFNKIIEIVKKYTNTYYAKVLLDETTPSNNLKEVIELNSLTEEARILSVKYSNLNFLNLENIHDLIVKLKLEFTLNKEELLDIYYLLKNTFELIIYYNDLKSKYNFINLNTIFNNLTNEDKLLKIVKNTIDETGEILDNASINLLNIRRNIKNINLDIKNKMNDYLISKKEMLSENVIVYRNNRACLCVKESYKNQIKGTIHDQSQSGLTFYIEPLNISLLYAKLNISLNEELEEINVILKKISKDIFEVNQNLINNYYLISKLDVIYAKAMYAIEIDGVLVKINDRKEINLIKGKHPLIKKEEVVPISVSLGKSHNAIIITGPNTGGKTVVLKTVGLFTLLLQSGILLPCDESSTMSIFDHVFVDIGDSQSIEQSLSTFSSHMLNIINILNNINNNSLVLLDELGSGTDPHEGSILAISIIDYLIEKDVRLITTTHYANLKSYAYNKEKVINASVEFDTVTLKPTYRLLLGVPGMSNAINISANLGLNKEILDKAIKLTSNKEDTTNDLIKKLEVKNLELIQKEKELDELIKKNKEDNLLYENSLNKIKEEEKKILAKANLEATNLLEKTKSEAKELITKLDEMKNEQIKEHKIASLKNEVNSLNIKNNVKKEIVDFKVNDQVMIDAYNRYGVVKQIKKDKFVVQVGNLEMNFKAEELSLYQNEAINKTTNKTIAKKKNYEQKPIKTAKLELDLRGCRYEEVHDLIDKFIDDAYMNGLYQINIIHGFGTGAVREATQKYLKKSPYVAETRFGGEFEGGLGVTVVTLK